MTAVPICSDPPLSEEWHAARLGGIGGSEIATLLGLNPYSTPIDLWLSKVGKAEPFAGNYATRRGQHMEAFVLSTFADEHPGMIIDTAPDDMPSIVAHPDVPEARCSLDALAHDPLRSYVVEIKTGNSRQVSRWEDGDMPDTYKAQVAYSLAVTGLDTAYVAADIGGDYLERVIHADKAFTDYVLEFVADWWAVHIIGGQMPDPDVVRDRDVLPHLWTADVTVEPVTLSDDLVARLRDAKAAKAAAITDYEVVAAEVQSVMRESVAAVDTAGDAVASWSPTKGRESIDLKRLRAEHPAIATELTMTGQPGRSFRVKG